jgi:O-methyltransferase
MELTPEKQYLELLKKTLTFTLWPEPPIALKTFNYKRSPLKQLLYNVAEKVLESKGLFIAKKRNITLKGRLEGRVCLLACADSMIGIERMNNLQACVESVLQENIPGDLIETGVWRGGSCILMRGVLAAYGIKDRRVWVADSFAGLPPPDVEKYPADAGSRMHELTYLAVSQTEVAGNFEKYGLLDEQVVFLPGRFEATLPGAPIEKLAVLRLDGDMYSSTICSLQHLYPKLSSGGYCIIDDYALSACKQAVDDYRRQNNITAPLMAIDWTGHYWRKD